MHVKDKLIYKPVITGYIILKIIEKLHPEFAYRKPYKEGLQPMINLLNGDEFILKNTLSIQEIETKFKNNEEEYSLMKERYHLYD